MNHLPDSFINRFDIRAICLHCRRLPIPLQQEQYEKCRWIDHRNIFCCLDTKYLLKEHNKLLKHLLHLKKKILKTTPSAKASQFPRLRRAIIQIVNRKS